MTKRPISQVVLKVDLGVYRPVTPDLARRFNIKDLRPSLNRFSGEAADMSVWLEQPIEERTPKWKACYRMVRQGPEHTGKSVIAEIRIIPIETEGHHAAGEWPGTHVGPRAAVPKGGISATVFKALRRWDTIDITESLLKKMRSGTTGKVREFLDEELPGPRRRGRPLTRKRAFYQDLADKYLQLKAERFERSGRSTKKILARQYKTSVDKIGYWLAYCRKLKLIPPTKRGQRGGFAAYTAYKEKTEKKVETFPTPSPRRRKTS